jgi:hypothetical protein
MGKCFRLSVRIGTSPAGRVLFCLLTGPETGIHLSDVYWATSKNLSFPQELFKEPGAAKPSVEVIENHRRIQQKNGH